MPEISDPVDSHWYALIVKPRVERHIGQVLEARGFEIFLPTHRIPHQRSRRTVNVDTPLFPNYLFARFRWPDRLKILTSPGVRSIVSFSGAPQTVSPTEIERLRHIVTAQVPVTACDYLESGSVVRITSGPLQGLEGKLIETKSLRRLVVNIEILHRAVAVEIDRVDVMPMAPRVSPLRL